MLSSASITKPAFGAQRAAAVRPARLSVRPCAAWTPALTKTELDAANGKKVVELNGQRVLVVETEGQVYAVSNKCSHLGLPLVGKTALLQGQVKEKCIVCPAHGTAFGLADGQVQGEWCPKLPNLPIVGKGPKQKPLPTFESRVTADGSIEVNMA